MKGYFFTFVIATMLLVAIPSIAEARSLLYGMTGSDVVELQNKLIAKGHLAAGYNTGYFGSLTQTAVRKYQCAMGIVCSGTTSNGYGVYGPRTQAAMNAGWEGDLEFSGWIPYWRKDDGVEDVMPHIEELTSIMPFGFTVKTDGTLADTAKLQEEPFASLIAEAKAQGVRVVPTVMWGSGETIHAILSNTTKRIALEDEIAALVKEYDFDGIDIDFEAKKHETIDYFSTFLKGLYQRMGKKWVYCTVEARMPLSHRYEPGATIPDDAEDFANDYTEMNKYCDRFEIMAYDQGVIDLFLNKEHEAPYAPTADTAWVEAMVNLAAETVDKKKIVIGVPTYGYEYAVLPVADEGYAYKVLWPFNPGYATEIAEKLGITPERNGAGELGFSYTPDELLANDTEGQYDDLRDIVVSTERITENASTPSAGETQYHYLSWSDAEAVQEKIDLAKKLGVRGIAVFKFDGGEDQGIWEVLKN